MRDSGVPLGKKLLCDQAAMLGLCDSCPMLLRGHLTVRGDFFSTLSCFGSDASALVVFGSSCFSYDDLATWLSSQQKTPRIGSPM
jgi:hypothetical protein